jgi:2-hydroxychromene-2-carboxylate isomerase
MPKLEFWYDFASHYAYLSAMRIEGVAKDHGVDVIWRPFLLGPIFKAAGYAGSPLQATPTKAAYTRRDPQRIAEARGLPLNFPDPFPQNSIKAGRVGLVGQREGWLPAFTQALYLAEFRDTRAIHEPAVLAAVLDGLGLESARILAHSEETDIKNQLKTDTEEAAAKGIFGAPTFITEDREIFWGDDRLEAAMAWARDRTG